MASFDPISIRSGSHAARGRVGSGEVGGFERPGDEHAAAAATAAMLCPYNADVPSIDQVIPPFCEYSSPAREPADPVKKQSSAEQTLPLAVRPVPAINVLRFRSVGSKARLAIDSEA
jgi:hypothetical protein